MISSESLLVALSFLAYLITAILYFRQLFARQQFLSKPALILLLVGLALHFASLVVHGIPKAGIAFPIETVLETLSFTSWCLVLVFVFIEVRWKITALGAFVLPLALITLAGSFWALHRATATPQPPQELNPTWLGMHVLLILFGYAAFALAFCTALAYLIQDTLLKRKQLQGISRQLPPVQVSDEAAYRLAALGFPIFTLGLIIGAIWASSTQTAGWAWDPKVIFSAVTWLVFVVYLHARMANGWKGRKAAALLIIGFCCAIITYVFTGFMQTGWHKF